MTEGLHRGLVRLALAALVLLAAPPLAEVAHAQTKVLTLAEALAIALHDHPQLRAVHSARA